MSGGGERGGEAAFDVHARVVTRALRVPTAIVTVVEEGRQVLVGLDGLGSPWAESRETPLTHSVCQYVVRDETPLVIPDTHVVDYLVGNLALSDLGVAAYAGWPITDHLGRIVGAVAAIDSQARAWSPTDLVALEDVATLCSAEMAARTRRSATLVDLEESERHGERGRVLLTLSEALSSTRSLGDIATALSRVTTDQLGCLHAGLWVRDDVVDADHVDIVGRPLRRATSRGPDQAGWPGAHDLDGVPVTTDLGAVVAAGEAVYLPPTDEDHDPRVACPGDDTQARALLPLVLGGRPLGLLVLVWPSDREIDTDARATLTALGAYTAQAVQRAALLEERVGVSLVLQRAMLSDLPSVPGIELAAQYLPAASREQVGGDWYDVVVLPGGDTVVAVGDVTGHDIAAASVMGQLRSMLRAIVTIDDGPPSQSLRLLDSVVDQVGLVTLASALLVRLHPPAADDDGAGRWRLTWSRAGHLPAVLVLPDGTAQLLGPEETPEGVDAVLDGQGGLLGLGAAERADQVREADRGSVLLLYTDGLVERRGEPLDVGLSRLCEAVAHHDGALDELIAGVVASQLSGAAPDDDVAILALRLG